MDYKNFGRGRDQIALDEHDEQAYQQAYGRATSTPGVSDSVPGIRPAHPLPSYRSNRLDYDRYLERPRDKFQIFSAQNRRRKARAIASSVALGLFVVACIVAIIVLLYWFFGREVGAALRSTGSNQEGLRVCISTLSHDSDFEHLAARLAIFHSNNPL